MEGLTFSRVRTRPLLMGRILHVPAKKGEVRILLTVDDGSIRLPSSAHFFCTKSVLGDEY